MTVVVRAPCGCACEVFVDGNRQRVVRQKWCRTKGHRTFGGSRVVAREWFVVVRGGVS